MPWYWSIELERKTHTTWELKGAETCGTMLELDPQDIDPLHPDTTTYGFPLTSDPDAFTWH